MKNLLFITTSSLAANPRLVKELESLKENYSCTVLCFKHYDWSLPLTQSIMNTNKDLAFVEIDRKAVFIESIFSKLCHKLAIGLNALFKTNFKVVAIASNDKSLQLLWRTKDLCKKQQFHTIIAHNLGAFYPAVKGAAYQNSKLQLDIEDFYPGEALYFNKAYEAQNRLQIMAQSFLKADVISYASRGIQLECEKHFKVLAKTKLVTIINAFKASDFKVPNAKTSERIQCVWFSQHIGPNRGLEQVFKAAKTLEHIEFHLIGNSNQAYLEALDISSNIILHPILKQEQLHALLSTMDIGLALENPKVDYNRNLCLTNKILAYAQAGLYILATNTFGQSQFLKALDYKAGHIMTLELLTELQQLDQSQLSYQAKTERWQKAKAFSWEHEQLKLKALFE